MSFNILNANRQKSITFQQYYEHHKAIVQSGLTENTEESIKELFDFYKLNLSRVDRINKQFSADKELKAILDNFSEKQTWVLFADSWCGDCAQNVSIIAKTAESSENIELLIFERDANLDLMDLYLTNGKRGIPKLIAFDNTGNELFQWGARPRPAQELVSNSIAAGIDKDEWHLNLHAWYAADKGKTLISELTKLILDTKTK